MVVSKSLESYLVDAEELWSQVSNAPKVALKSIDEIEKQIVDHSRQWYQSMLDEIKKADFTPNDYNPPRYQWQKNTTEEVKSQSYRTQVTLTRRISWQYLFCRSLF